MPLDTHRAFGPVAIDVNRQRCRACGACARVCSAEVLMVEGGRLVADPGRGLGCLACGLCVCAFPPSQVGVLVAHGREQVQQLRRDLLPEVRGMRKVMGALRPLQGLMLGREAAEGFRRFVMPVAKSYEEHDARGEDVFFYDAPLALYFYGRVLADPADPVIAATFAMIAAQSLGLGTCLLGFPGPLMKQSAKLRSKYGLPEKIQPGMCLVVGHPAVKFRRGVRRRFAEVRSVS